MNSYARSGKTSKSRPISETPISLLSRTKPKSDCVHYRGIAFLSTAVKILLMFFFTPFSRCQKTYYFSRCQKTYYLKAIVVSGHLDEPRTWSLLPRKFKTNIRNKTRIFTCISLTWLRLSTPSTMKLSRKLCPCLVIIPTLSQSRETTPRQDDSNCPHQRNRNRAFHHPYRG